MKSSIINKMDIGWIDPHDQKEDDEYWEDTPQTD